MPYKVMNVCLSLRLEIVQISGKDKSETLSSNMSARGVHEAVSLTDAKLENVFRFTKGYREFDSIIFDFILFYTVKLPGTSTVTKMM